MATYYLNNLASNASDSNSGKSPNSPFATLAALNRVLRPGDTVKIQAGTSYSGELDISSSGTSGAPITFTKAGSGADPVIDGTGHDAGIKVTGSYITISGIDDVGGTDAGVQLTNSSHDLMENMQVSEAGEGFNVTGGGNDRFLGNYVHDLNMVVNTPTPTNDDYGAIAFDISKTSNDEFAYNKINHAQAQSYDYGADGGAFEVWQSVSNISIHDNLAENSNGFLEIGGTPTDTASNINVYGNVSDNNGDFSWLHNDLNTNFGMKITGLNEHNNTIYSPQTWQIVGADAPITPGTVYFTSNAVFAPQSDDALAKGVTHTGNFYQAAVAPTGRGEVSGTIDFTNVSASDFSIVANTPAAGYGAYHDGATPGMYAAAAAPGTTVSASMAAPAPTGLSSGTATSTGFSNWGSAWHNLHSFGHW